MSETARDPWLDRSGAPIVCAEKRKVLAENAEELLGVMRDAFEDAVLMGVAPESARRAIAGMIAGLQDPTRA